MFIETGVGRVDGSVEVDEIVEIHQSPGTFADQLLTRPSIYTPDFGDLDESGNAEDSLVPMDHDGFVRLIRACTHPIQ